jgi:hypothetical protein
MAPDAGVTVGLELQADRQRVRPALINLTLGGCDLSGDAEQVLHVMAYLVRHDVRLSELPTSAEALIELTKERQIEIDLAVGRAVKGAGLCAPQAAARLRGFIEEDEDRRYVGLTVLAEDLTPRTLCVGKHN